MYKFSHSKSDDHKIDVLRLESSKRQTIQPISNINLNKDIKKIKFSINNPMTKTINEEYLELIDQHVR
jgi:hypothetical protein